MRLRVAAPYALLLALVACSSSSSSPSGPAADSGKGNAVDTGTSSTDGDTGAEGDAGSDAALDDSTSSADETGAIADSGAAPGDSAASDAMSDAGDASDTSTPPSNTARVRVHYPAGTHKISIRGSTGPWNWSTGVAMTSAGSDTWTIETEALTGATEWKPLLDDSTWSRGPNYVVHPGETVDVYPHFTQVAGTYSRAYSFHSNVLNNDRGIWIYYPPTYLENTDAKLPVLYMHDGQNLFDASTAFGGNEWKVDETMNAGAESGAIAEAIVIGIENTADRIPEYTPTVDPAEPPGGNGDNYLKMIVTELKPKIDGSLRTLPDVGHTAMMGSSLGGLITAYAGTTHADVFGLVGAMSPSTWWDSDVIVTDVAATKGKTPRPLRVYVDSGDSGTSNDDVTETATLAQTYRDVGYVDASTLLYVVQKGGQHSEIYWAQRLPAALHYLLGARAYLPAN